MGLALQWGNREQNAKRVCIVLLVVITLVLCSSVAIAAGLGIGSEKLVQRDGVTSSELLVGRGGGSSWLYIGEGDVGIHFNPSSAPYHLISIYTLVFVAGAIILLVGLFATGSIGFETLLFAAVLIYMLVALLTPMQEMITGLLR